MSQNRSAGDDGDAATSAMARVVERVEELVFDELEPGHELPSEGALAQDLGVSRLTVREGMRQLSARGLIEVHNGRKPVVASPNGKGVGDFFRNAIRRDPRALLDLLEVRQALEVHIAVLAARNASRASIGAMQSAIDEMRRNIETPAEFNEADVHFHELLAAATGNQLLTILIEELSDSQRSSRVQSVIGHELLGRRLDEVLEQHAKILDCVERRDESGAAAAMRSHLRSTEKDLAAALR
ncbi:FadR/GntR family transcriptional regulator [Microbacterium candidum]|uniref:FadR/GntR family transcriptional regulator n=1 Tax=Microbacterium candidum TaxID=3041922 RepID=A0ABT7MWA8_9MICO|nr:FadR/GntR family transcriptional regulator [Microbacterium sp. ASV49]MDL9978741.1 FadR/GntR family transcriptional regulator [Microbacterium sp. ASV49]